jgi:hypothetical protein
MLRSALEERGLRKLSRRETALVAALALVAVAGGAALLRRPEAAPAQRARAKAEAPLPPVPHIDLARLDRPPAENEAGRRDLFAFGARAEPEPPEQAPPPAVAPPPSVAAPGGLDAAADRRPAAPTLPPLNLRYIGSVESARGVKVAVLVTDRREVLTGQAGEVVANRYRIARIGLESVDLEDVGTGQSRRIPLRGGS